MILVNLILIKRGCKLSLAMRNIFPNYFYEGLTEGNTDVQTRFKNQESRELGIKRLLVID